MYRPHQWIWSFLFVLTLEISVCFGQEGGSDDSNGEEKKEDKNKPLDPVLIEAMKQGKQWRIYIIKFWMPPLGPIFF